MRVCIVGKYPPIEGGVSSSTYWLAHGLAARGHEVHVVTNAEEVEERYRITLGLADLELFQPEFPDCGGRVRVHNVEAFSRRAMAHIPVANPYVTRLASLATEVVRRHRCEVIFAYYFEPYGVSAWLASRWTDRPLIVKHAGSDLDRLARVPDLATAYKEVVRSADAVVTRTSLIPRFVGMGVAPERITVDRPFALPPVFFGPDAPVLDVAAVALGNGAGDSPQPFDPTIPTIGVYGKIGEAKGTFDLLRALGRLAAEGRSFNFLAMIGGASAEFLNPAIAQGGIAEQTTILPFMPNWRVPSFIRACTAVCFLERDFPVAIHGPIVPREIMSCGTCLVLSREILDKQAHRDALRPGENLLVVDNPQDGDELTAVLRSVVDDPEWAAHLGKAGALLAQPLEDFDAFISSWEVLFGAHARAWHDHPAVSSTPASLADALERVAPTLLYYLRAAWPAVIEDFASAFAGGPMDSPGIGQHFCTFVADRLSTGPLRDHEPVLRDALRYQSARIGASHDRADGAPPFAVVDQLGGRPVTELVTDELFPVRTNNAWVEEFDYDVSGLFPPWPTSNDEDPDFDGVAVRSLLVLFQRQPNLIPRELEIDRATLALLDRCDGRRTCGELVTATAEGFGTPDDAQARDAILAALDRLYKLGVIVFGRTDPVRGWRHGARSDIQAIPPLRRTTSAARD
jgi:glycosyltransferase involved in cell wall biosynthesis